MIRVGYTIAIIVVSWTGISAYSQADRAYHKIHAPELLQADLDLLVRALKEAYPGLYRNNSPASFDAYTGWIRSRFDQPMALAEYYTVLQKLIAGLHDGHMTVELPLSIQQHQKLLPLSLRLVSPDRVLIEKDFSPCFTGKYPVELLEVEGMDMPAILDQHAHHICSDGAITTNRLWALQKLGLSKIMYGTYSSEDSVRIKVASSGRVYEVKVPRMPASKLNSAFEDWEKKTRIKPLQLEFRKDQQTAILSIHTFYPPLILKSKKFYSAFLRRSFRRIKRKKIRQLIVDLRQNSGGESMYAIELFRYMTTTPFRGFQRMELTDTDTFSFAQHTHLPQKFKGRPENHVKDPNGYYHVRSHPALEVQTPHKNSFTGPVHVLISGRTFSAAVLFCSLARAKENIVFAGEETGGTYRNFSAGAMPVLTLPHTGIRVRFPLLNVTVDVAPADVPQRGIQAEIPLRSDADMNAVLEAIKRSKKTKRDF